ncbi:MAG: hypothetical protein GF416_07020 [Candidatus Altiarchaeales archaeon]|nr:hypothetical protein [Candidatus Altiarchaeales archaeon]MBD3416864.1 hypothetical protein [Candidatus Altiarchaeales archaeon]
MKSRVLIILLVLSLSHGCIDISVGTKPPRGDVDLENCELVRCSYHFPRLDPCLADSCCEPAYNKTGDYVNCRIKAKDNEG